MKRNVLKYDEMIHVKVTKKDKIEIEKDAKAKGLETSTYIRLRMGCRDVFR